MAENRDDQPRDQIKEKMHAEQVRMDARDRSGTAGLRAGAGAWRSF
jgi:hypothetical protein